jgi:erythronate-4-phosphate dehydrogenase
VPSWTAGLDSKWGRSRLLAHPATVVSPRAHARAFALSGMKVFADPNIAVVAEAFCDLGDVQLVPGREWTPSLVRHADVLLVRSVTRVDAELLQDGRARFVGTATSGVDHIDRTYLSHRGIAFAAAPGSNAQALAEYVVSALLVLAEAVATNR